MQEYRVSEEDRLLERIAYQLAGVMLSSGNLKKSATVESVVESIYAPLVPREEHSKGREVTDDQEEAREIVQRLAAKMNKQ